MPRTIRVRHEVLNVGNTSPRTLQYKAWRVTIGPVPQGRALVIDGVSFAPGAVIRVGGSDTHSVIYYTATVSDAVLVPVTVETLDPDTR